MTSFISATNVVDWPWAWLGKILFFAFRPHKVLFRFSSGHWFPDAKKVATVVRPLLLFSLARSDSLWWEMWFMIIAGYESDCSNFLVIKQRCSPSDIYPFVVRLHNWMAYLLLKLRNPNADLTDIAKQLEDITSVDKLAHGPLLTGDLRRAVDVITVVSQRDFDGHPKTVKNEKIQRITQVCFCIVYCYIFPFLSE